ncbi:MAG: Crp/Fnr family transcriptional regulator [Gammaproteobacteria bacterium]|nr:Crp/Fnr family transcriptional regulator [Gammaproteobacteria bacterium]
MQVALKSSHLLSGLSEAQIASVHKHAHSSELEEGKALFCQGDSVNSFYLVISGKIKLFRVSQEGKEKVVDIVNPGDTFAEALMFMDQPMYPVNATALMSCKVLGINVRHFKNMLRESVDTCFLLMGSMSSRLRGLIQEIDTLSLNTGTVRIVSYLLQHAPDDRDYFDLDIAKSVIASRLSVKPETFSRILKNLHTQNILTISGRNVTIHDRKALISIAPTHELFDINTRADVPIHQPCPSRSRP